MRLSRISFLTVFLPTFAFTLSSAPSWGAPDPLGERHRPEYQRPAPPPERKAAPAPDPAATGDEPAADPGPGSRTRVGTATSASLDRQTAEAPRPARPGAGTAGGSQGLGADDGTYRLGPRDQLKVEVWNRAEVEYEWRPVTVTDDGTINLPLLENVKVGGLTVTEAAARLNKLYDSFIIEPQVFIQIAEYNSRQINVRGEVKNPGRFSLKGEMSLTQVIAAAGDLTKNASKTVRIIRDRGPDQSPEVRDIDLDRLNQGDAREDIRIMPDDQIYVLTNNKIVFVSGAVKGEGYVDYEDGMTAQQAIILAGGLADGSAGGRTKIFRVNAAGKTIEYKINVKNKKEPFLLQPGDIIHVPRSIL
jgi:polysaccharide export outer membrane protein